MSPVSVRSCHAIAAAGFAALCTAVPTADADYYYSGPDGGSWYDAANWTESASETTGALPTGNSNINTGVADTGVVFDPAIQIADPDATYAVGRLYISSTNVGPDVAAHNYLTVNSGTLNTGDQFHVGRHAAGTLNMNGGTLIVNDFRVTDSSATSATINYSGGTVSVTDRIRMAKGSGSTSHFAVGHSAGGRITTGNDFVMAEGSNSHATVAFHYENGGVQTIEVGDELSLRNAADPTTRSARLDLVLEEAPLLNLGVPADLALFDIANPLGTTTNQDGLAEFRNAANTAYYAQGDLVEASFAGLTYQWTISYVGNISMSGGVVTGVSGTGGSDVVLVGLGVVPEPATAGLLALGALAIVRRRG